MAPEKFESPKAIRASYVGSVRPLVNIPAAR
jgi:hypothetical protein